MSAEDVRERPLRRLQPETQTILRSRLKSYLYPYIRSRPIAQIAAPELLAALRKTEARDKHETALRARAIAGRIFRHAIATGRGERDVSADLKDALAAAKSTNFAAITMGCCSRL